MYAENYVCPLIIIPHPKPFAGPIPVKSTRTSGEGLVIVISLSVLLKKHIAEAKKGNYKVSKYRTRFNQYETLLKNEKK